VERHIQIAVGRDGQVTRWTEVVGNDGGAETRGQRESAVVRIARSRPGQLSTSSSIGMLSLAAIFATE